ncbi:arginase family protein [Campylobacter troglodytis]|uniref:arginase family protein n=1 Tax=Campylobacter troglodytis TaxID=654363 RepID=UPI0011584378|nr:arginase family protein [Campylobacter troglodytis]TQR53931.1 arginase [Campylobacter troglodytis]
MQNTLKLIYPQWQGGVIAGWFKDLKPENSAKGYVLGAQILDLLVSNLNANLDKNTAVVPVSLNYSVDKNGERLVQEGIVDKFILQEQTKRAYELINAKKPTKILTLGGECAVSVPSFTYLASLYKDDLVVLWVDAHPDLGVANDEFYKGYHAMAVSAIVGDEVLSREFALPASVSPDKVLFVGLHSNEALHYKARREALGIQSVDGTAFVSDEAKALSQIKAWIKQCGAKKVAIHLDLDVLNPKELYVAVGNTGILSVSQVINAINTANESAEIVGLTIAEHFPKAQIQLKTLLENLPLIKP